MKKIVIGLLMSTVVTYAHNSTGMPASNIGIGTTTPIAPLQIFGDMVGVYFINVGGFDEPVKMVITNY
jgi:hypothetical protein